MVKHDSFGNRSFDIASQRVWNVLPSSWWKDIGYEQFKQLLRILETFSVTN